MPALENEKHERFCQLLLVDPEARALRVPWPLYDVTLFSAVTDRVTSVR